MSFDSFFETQKNIVICSVGNLIVILVVGIHAIESEKYDNNAKTTLLPHVFLANLRSYLHKAL